MRTHYPRTPHLPWSPGAASDDVRVADLSGLLGREVVVTEKLDGENTTLYADGLHARSLDSAHHPSRAWVKALQGRIGARHPGGLAGVRREPVRAALDRVRGPGELVLRVLGLGRRRAAWTGTGPCGFCGGLGVPAPPVLWRGVFDERALRARCGSTPRGRRVTSCGPSTGFGPRGVRAAGGQVGAARARTDRHALDARRRSWRTGSARRPRCGRSGPGAAPDARGAARPRWGSPEGDPDAAAAVADVSARLDALGRTGDARLAGVLAALLHGAPRAWLAAPAGGTAGHAARPAASPTWSGCTRCCTGRTRTSSAGPGWYGCRPRPTWGCCTRSPAAGSRRTPRRASRWTGPRCTPRTPGCSASPLEPLRAGCGEALADLDTDAADRCWAEARERVRRRGASRPSRRPSRRPGGGGPGTSRGWSTWSVRRAAGRAPSRAACPASTRRVRSTTCARPAARAPTSGPTGTCCARAWTGSTPRWPTAGPWCGTPPPSTRTSVPWCTRSPSAATP